MHKRRTREWGEGVKKKRTWRGESSENGRPHLVQNLRSEPFRMIPSLSVSFRAFPFDSELFHSVPILSVQFRALPFGSGTSVWFRVFPFSSEPFV